MKSLWDTTKANQAFSLVLTRCQTGLKTNTDPYLHTKPSPEGEENFSYFDENNAVANAVNWVTAGAV